MPMCNMGRSILRMLLVYVLLLGSPSITASQDWNALSAEARQLTQQVGEPFTKGRFAKANPFAERALPWREKFLDAGCVDVAESLNNLAKLYQPQNRDELAEAFRLAERALTMMQDGLYAEALPLHIHAMTSNQQAARLALTTVLQRKGRVLDAMTDQIASLRMHATREDQALLDQFARDLSYLATMQISPASTWAANSRQQEIAKTEAEVERRQDEISRRSVEFRSLIQPVSLDAVLQAIPRDAALVEIFLYEQLNPKAKSRAEEWVGGRYVAYVLRPESGSPLWVELGDAAEIEAEVKLLREALRDPKRTDIQKAARAVDERIMQPIRKLLGRARRLLLSPDGALNLIPFEALVDENGKYLIENYPLSYLASGRDLLRLRTQVGSQSASLVIANPQFDLTAAMPSVRSPARKSSTQSDENRRSTEFTLKTYRPLPGTSEEAELLGKLMPDAKVLIQENATESALKQARGPKVLHIATHGFFLPDLPRELSATIPERVRLRGTSDLLPLPARWENPLLRSGLILAGVNQQQSSANEDGVLTALEVAGLDLWGTKLVVLSACDTGLGDVKNGVGVYGLRRALVLAGSETQVMSLWKVSDDGTRDLMTASYTRLQKGEGRSEALRQVKLAMLHGQLKATASDRNRGTIDTGEKLATKDYRHPYFWAAFIQSGDWRSLDGKDVRAQ
jgi:CHAT domain-containing protein